MTTQTAPPRRHAPPLPTDLSVDAVQRRTLRVLVLAQIFGGAGLAAGVSVGALLAKELLGSTSGAGLPAALFAAGSAGAAMAVGRLSDRRGRRIGLAAGYLTGALGGAAVVIASVIEAVPLLLVALVVYGAGTATNLQCRYAGADLADDAHRGRAISTVLVATTVGAVAGPTLLRQTGDLAVDVGLPRLSGPFILATAAYLAAGLIIAAFLRPDPLLMARQLDADRNARGPDHAGDDVHGALVTPDPASRAVDGQTRRRSTTLRAIVLAASGMVLAQAVMVAVMTMTPVHLQDHDHGLDVVGLIIGAHIAAMYLPSPVTGRLVDRHGPTRVTIAGATVLITAGAVAAGAGASAPILAVALTLLGLGWNLALVGGTAQVTALTPLDQRARTQGAVDLGVALAGAAGGLASGAILAASSFRSLAVIAAVVAAVVIPAASAARRSRLPAPATG